jgi:hypothetical protein
MNTKEAIQKLRNLNYKVCQEGEKYRVTEHGHKEYCDSPLFSTLKKEDYHIYTARELINLAKYAGRRNFPYSIKKEIKKISKTSLRTKAKNALSSKDEDKIDAIIDKSPSVKSDLWNWT